MLAANSCLEIHGGESTCNRNGRQRISQTRYNIVRQFYNFFAALALKASFIMLYMFHSFTQFVDVCGQYQQPYSRQENFSFFSRYRAKSALTLQRHVTYLHIYYHLFIHTHRLYKWTKKGRTQNPFEHVLVISGHEECNLCRFVTLSNLQDAKAEGGSLATGGLHQFGEDPIESNQVPFTRTA